MTEQAEKPTESGSSSNPYTLWFVLAIFTAPVIASYYMFFFGDITSFTNNGDFIRPYYPVETLALMEQEQPFTSDSLNKRWLIMMAVGASCDESCQQQLINLRQINKAVKRPTKVRYAILQTATPDAALQTFIDEEHGSAVRLEADVSKLGDSLPLMGQTSEMYLSDPLGNMVMKFSHELTPKLVIKDLNRLF